MTPAAAGDGGAGALTLAERRLAYIRAFPQWPDSWPVVSPTGRWLYGHWQIGALFRNLSAYYGAYPRTYVERVRALFPEVRESQILHCFSGSLPKSRAVRLDARAELRPEMCGSVYDLAALLEARGAWRPRLVMADPPYTAGDAAKYGAAPLHKARAMRAIAAAVPAGTCLAWLDEMVPMYRGEQWRKWVSITVIRSTNQATRELSLFVRV